MIKLGERLCAHVRFVLESLGLGFKFGDVALPSIAEQDQLSNYSPRQKKVLRTGKKYMARGLFRRTNKRGQ